VPDLKEDIVTSMRLGMVVPTLGFAGGIERHAHDLAASLSARGHSVTLLHGPRAGRDQEAYKKPFVAAIPLEDPGAGRGLDVVYAHKVTDVRDLASLAGVPVIIVAHDHDLTCVRSHRYLPLGHAPCHRPPGVACVLFGCVVVRDRRPGARLPILISSPFALRDRLLELADRGPLVACSRYVASGLVAAGVPSSRVHAIHTIPPEDPAPLTPRPREKRLVAAGQLLRGKGFWLPIQALQHLPADVTLDLVGDGPMRAELEALAQELAPGRVRFLGYVPPSQLSAVYDSASVVVVPSHWPEPFGMVGIEAMRRARPVVGAGHGGIPEWLTDGEGGFVFSPGDPVDLARAARALLADPEAGERAREAAVQRFPYRRLVDTIEALLVATAAGRSFNVEAFEHVPRPDGGPGAFSLRASAA
jgi:glycosyltransferase involved in cell wall biosynthesis